MLKTMFDMQKMLDEAIYKEHQCEFSYEKTRLALMDEIGEMIHELKGNWCWWKKTQKPVDRAKVLEELVDCFHFGMSIDYHYYKFDKAYERLGLYIEGFKEMGKTMPLGVLVSNVMNEELCIARLIQITYNLGFTIKEVYDAYLIKNAVNFRRLQEGY